MAILHSTKIKIIALIAISALVFAVWKNVLEVGYAKVLLAGTNGVLSFIKNDTHIEIEKENNVYQFRVFTRVEGRKGNYPQPFGSILQPFVILLSWQLFLLLALDYKLALKPLAVNVGAFYIVQSIFLVQLTGYYNNDFQKFIFDLLMDSFYIFALVLVIKDAMLYPVFVKRTGK